MKAIERLDTDLNRLATVETTKHATMALRAHLHTVLSTPGYRVLDEISDEIYEALHAR